MKKTKEKILRKKRIASIPKYGFSSMYGMFGTAPDDRSQQDKRRARKHVMRRASRIINRKTK